MGELREMTSAARDWTNRMPPRCLTRCGAKARTRPNGPKKFTSMAERNSSSAWPCRTGNLQGRPALDTTTSTSGRSSAAPDSLIVGDIQLDGDNSVAVVLDGVREGISTPGGSVNALGTTCEQRLHEVTAQSAVRARHKCVRSTKLHG